MFGILLKGYDALQGTFKEDEDVADMLINAAIAPAVSKDAAIARNIEASVRAIAGHRSPFYLHTEAFNAFRKLFKDGTSLREQGKSVLTLLQDYPPPLSDDMPLLGVYKESDSF